MEYSNDWVHRLLDALAEGTHGAGPEQTGDDGAVECAGDQCPARWGVVVGAGTARNAIEDLVSEHLPANQNLLSCDRGRRR